MLLVDVLRSYVATKRFVVDDFVVMPDHFHALLTVDESMSIEKAMQLVKGGFSYRLKKETGYAGEVWQRGFSEIRVEDRESLLELRKYIAENPVKARLANSAQEYPYCYSYLARRRRAGAEAQSYQASILGTAKAVP